MTIRARALDNLYRCGKISMAGLKRAVDDGIITAEEYREITGKDYI